MKIIALEEHFQIPAIKEALAKLLPDAQAPFSITVSPEHSTRRYGGRSLESDGHNGR